MSESTIRFPVVCPKCGREQLGELPIDEVVYALNGGSDISLVATCHDVIWTATEPELHQIHEYLDAGFVDTLDAAAVDMHFRVQPSKIHS
ncbi:MAG: hypothetical protein QOF42_2008 [Gammaproteobacteria bacterium]|jgi:hypothetical protein|nr:hypothetical protein [Gammaproteobacteria bacterium]